MNIIYKKCSENDYEFIYTLKKEVYMNYIIEYYGEYDEKVQRYRFDKRIKKVKDNTYLIYYNDKRVGFYTIDNNDNYLEIENICILKEYQGLGIGTKVINDIINMYDKNIILQYFKINPVGNLYKRLGFIINGENDNHYKMIRKR